MIFGFDVVSDLNLTKDSVFDWEGKPTSLYCIVAGNISKDLSVVQRTLHHLCRVYQGVFYIDGALEYDSITEHDARIKELTKVTAGVRNLVYLHNNVVVIDGIALVGLNGWYGNYEPQSAEENFHIKCFRYEDITYLEKTIERLQLHVDVKKIVIISNSVPSPDVLFGETILPADELAPVYVLPIDTEHKITHWVFGSHKKIVDTPIGNINYLNNPCYDKKPYYPKRITVEF